MDPIIITEQEVGKEFLIVLEKLVTIRRDKRHIYGDTFIDDGMMFLIMQLENKIKRIKLHIENKTEINNVEKALDNALDMGVYSLFIATKLVGENK
jgi:hypothetical protein